MRMAPICSTSPATAVPLPLPPILFALLKPTADIGIPISTNGITIDIIGPTARIVNNGALKSKTGINAKTHAMMPRIKPATANLLLCLFV